MKSSHHTSLLKWMALAGVCAAVAATSAQAGGPPPDPGWLGLPHCTVPNIEGKQLATAKRKLHGSLCGVIAPVMRRRSTAARNTVLTATPEPGTILAPGTKVLLVVAR
jgi:PASTA domain